MSRYFRGRGIDIGGEANPLLSHIELFPLVTSILVWSSRDRDAQRLSEVPDESYDFVFSCHCLVRLDDPAMALSNWFRILRPGGHLIFSVPDEDLYEQGVFPSSFNPSHKWTATIYKKRSWSPRSLNLLELIMGLGERAEILKIQLLHDSYRFGLSRTDQTMTPIAESAIEVVLRKRTTEEHQARGRHRRPDPIYGPRHGEFGDCWAMVSELVDLSISTGQEVFVSRYNTNGDDMRRLIEEILEVLETDGARLNICDSYMNNNRLLTVCTNKRPYRRTKIQWNGTNVKGQACYQLESKQYMNGKYVGRKYSPNDQFRLIPQEELEEINKLFQKAPYEMIPIGKHLGIEGSIRVASQSKFFIGIDSGMSHLCHSVGVPVYLYEGRPAPLSIFDFHPGKKFRLFKCFADVARILEEHR